MRWGVDVGVESGRMLEGVLGGRGWMLGKKGDGGGKGDVGES